MCSWFTVWVKSIPIVIEILWAFPLSVIFNGVFTDNLTEVCTSSNQMTHKSSTTMLTFGLLYLFFYSNFSDLHLRLMTSSYIWQENSCHGNMKQLIGRSVSLLWRQKVVLLRPLTPWTSSSTSLCMTMTRPLCSWTNSRWYLICTNSGLMIYYQ